MDARTARKRRAEATNLRRAALRTVPGLESSLRASLVFLKFARPVPRPVVDNFYRVRASAEMLADAEAEFFRPETTQRSRCGRQVCPRCGGLTSRTSEFETVCRNPSCLDANGRPSSETPLVNGPVRGVVQVLVFDDFVVGRVGSMELLDGVVLALDRRYDEEARVRWYRTCGALCEIVSAERGVDLRLRDR